MNTKRKTKSKDFCNGDRVIISRKYRGIIRGYKKTSVDDFYIVQLIDRHLSYDNYPFECDIFKKNEITLDIKKFENNYYNEDTRGVAEPRLRTEVVTPADPSIAHNMLKQDCILQHPISPTTYTASLIWGDGDSNKSKKSIRPLTEIIVQNNSNFVMEELIETENIINENYDYETCTIDECFDEFENKEQEQEQEQEATIITPYKTTLNKLIENLYTNVNKIQINPSNKFKKNNKKHNE